MYRMYSLVNSHGDALQLLMFVGLFLISWNIENIAGAFVYHKKWNHAFTNAPFIFSSMPGQFILGIAFIKTISWTNLHHFGLLHLIHTHHHPLLRCILAFILLDFGEYIYHVIMHKVKSLWSFHMVHHSDQVVDVSTTLREHPGENIIRLCFTLVWVLLSGVTFWMLMIRQIIQAISTIFAHMNYRLSDKLDNTLNIVFITPNLHQVHHHFKQPYTDCNYGDVLSIWDRIFGTLKKLPADQLQFGIDTHMSHKDCGNFFSLIKLPFKKRRKLNS